MATEHQTLEAPGNECEDGSHQQALPRATDILRTLQHAARAARLEAQVVELEAAIAKARGGDVRTLQAWLDSFEPSPSSLSPIQNAGNDSWIVKPAIAAQTPGQSQAHDQSETCDQSLNEAPQSAQGWSDYLPHALRRLDDIQRQYGHALPWQSNPSTIDKPPNPQDACNPDSLEQTHDDTVAKQVEQQTEPQGASSGSLEFTDSTEQHDEQHDEQLSEASLACLGDLHASPVATAAPSLPLSKRIFGSYGFSIAGHAIALIILGSMTYQAPKEGSSLGAQVLNAAEASSDTELTSEVEMLEPTDLQISEPIENATPSTSIASELSQLSQSVTPVAVDATANSSVGSSIASAISEATGKSGSGSRGSGVPSMNGSFFGVGTGGNYFCYVVDSSGSMRGGAWDSAKAELLRSLKSLKPTQKFYIVFFADEFTALPEPGSDQPAASGLYATPENIDHARRWIQSVQLNRGGPPTDALAWAIEREPDAIYLLTDGVTKVDVCGFLRKHNRIEDIVSDSQVRVPIHAIAYFSLDGQQLMRQLAKENKGQFIYVPKPKK